MLVATQGLEEGTGLQERTGHVRGGQQVWAMAPGWLRKLMHSGLRSLFVDVRIGRLCCLRQRSEAGVSKPLLGIGSMIL